VWLVGVGVYHTCSERVGWWVCTNVAHALLAVSTTMNHRWRGVFSRTHASHAQVHTYLPPPPSLHVCAASGWRCRGVHPPYNYWHVSRTALMILLELWN
jgi:hypothetical protein